MLPFRDKQTRLIDKVDDESEDEKSLEQENLTLLTDINQATDLTFKRQADSSGVSRKIRS